MIASFLAFLYMRDQGGKCCTFLRTVSLISRTVVVRVVSMLLQSISIRSGLVAACGEFFVKLILLGRLSITLKDMSVHVRQSTLEGIRVACVSSCLMADVVSSTRSSGCASTCGSSCRGSVCPGAHVLFGLYFLFVLFLVYTFFLRLSNLRS